MKFCPVCKMTVSADTECPICKATLTYEPSVDGKRQKYVMNRYLLLYLLKRYLFSVVCIITVGTKMLISKPSVDAYFVVVATLSLLTLIASVLELRLVRLATRFHTEAYAIFSIKLFKILCGLVSVILALVIL